MRNRRHSDIVLDFTSLLDVTLILLFFFIMFSSFQTENEKKETEEAIKEAAEKTVEAEEKIKKADMEIAQAEEKANQAEERAKEAEEALKEAAEKNEENKELAKNAEMELENIKNELETMKELSRDSGKMIDSIEDFKKGENLKIICTATNSEDWKIEIRLKDQVVAVVEERNKSEDTLIEILKDYPGGNYFFCETILCNKMYIQQNNAYTDMKDKAIQKYGGDHFIISETNIKNAGG